MHTGQMPHRTGVVENHTLPDGRRSFMEILSDSGYQTLGAGKMHFAFESGMATLWDFTERRISDTGDDEPNDFRRTLEESGLGHVAIRPAFAVRCTISQVSQLPPRLNQTSWTADSSTRIRN